MHLFLAMCIYMFLQYRVIVRPAAASAFGHREPGRRRERGGRARWRACVVRGPCLQVVCKRRMELFKNFEQEILDGTSDVRIRASMRVNCLYHVWGPVRRIH